MNNIKKAVVIAASPKPQGKAASDLLAHLAAETLRGDALDVQVVNARKAIDTGATGEAFAAMADADALVIVFPLYIFCLPGITMRFLQMYKAYADALPTHKTPLMYAVVNCGFPEPEINGEAAHVIKRFADAIGARYRFGILIGGGGMAAMNVSPVKRMRAQYIAALRRIRVEIETASLPPVETVHLRINFPRRLYFIMGNMGWRRWIRKHGKKPRDLKARPYQP